MGWKEKLENNIVWFALCLLAVGWIAGVGTCRFFQELAGVDVHVTSPSKVPAPTREVLAPTWIGIPGSVPFLDGQCSLQVEGDRSGLVFLSVLGAEWVGYRGPSLQILDPGRRHVTRNEKKYAVDIMALETNRIQCSVHELETNK